MALSRAEAHSKSAMPVVGTAGLRKAIARAKMGFIIELNVVLTNLNSECPNDVAHSALSMFLSHIASPAARPAETAELSTDDQFYAMRLVMGSILGLGLLFNHLVDNSHFRQTLMGAWPDLIFWMDYIQSNREYVCSGMETLNTEGLDGALAKIFFVALRADCSPSVRDTVEARARNDLPELWMREDVGSCSEPFITSQVTNCLMMVDDRKLFMRTFVAKSVGSNEAVVERLLKLGKTLLKKKPVNHFDTSTILRTFVSFCFSEHKMAPDVLPIWDVTLKNTGVIPFALKVFDKLSHSNELRLDPPPEDVTSAVYQCMKFFQQFLRQHAYGRNGAAALIKLLRGGFLDSFVRCSQIFPSVERTAGVPGEFGFCRLFLTRYLSLNLAYPLVIKTFASAMESLDVEAKRQFISRSSMQMEWNNLETLVLERLIYKRLYELAEDFVTSRGKKFAYLRRCSTCMVASKSVNFQTCSKCRDPVYCSKECQKVHWTEGNHKKDCGVDADNRDVVKASLGQNTIFASMLADHEVSRYLPGLRKMVTQKYSSLPLWQVAFSLDLTWNPVRIGVFCLSEVLDGTKLTRDNNDMQRSGLKSEEWGFLLARSMRNSEIEDPEIPGITECNGPDGYSIKTYIGFGDIDSFGDAAGLENSRLIRDMARTGPRIRGVDFTGKVVESVPGVVEIVIHHLGFRNSEDWYVGGRGSVEKLIKKVDVILHEHFEAMIQTIAGHFAD